MDCASSLRLIEATERRCAVVNSVRASFLFYRGERRDLFPPPNEVPNEKE